MKRWIKSKLLSLICAFAILLTISSSIYAYANVRSGSCTIEANKTTTICNVKKTDTSKYGTIFLKKSLSNVSNFTIKVWMVDTTNGKTLTDQKVFNCTSTSTGHWLPFKSGVSFTVNDNVRFYGYKTGATRGIDYTACAYWAFL